MLSSTEKIIAVGLAPHIIHSTDLECLFKGTPASRYGLVNKALNKGELIQLKRGAYIVAPKFQKHYFSLNYLANHIVPFSYVTAESALWFHGWTPERVATQVTSVAAFGRNKVFQTDLAQFIYHVHPIATHNFFIGVSAATVNGQFVWIATPLRAIIDYIYWHKIDNADRVFLQSSLRIELEHIMKITPAEINQLMPVYKSVRVKAFLKKLLKEI